MRTRALKRWRGAVALALAATAAAAACGDGRGFGADEAVQQDGEFEIVAEAVPPPPEVAPAPASAARELDMQPMSGAAAERGAAADIPLPDQAQAPAQDTAAPNMIIRTGHARIEVDSLEVAVAQVEALAQEFGGYVANSSIQAGDRRLREGTLELKIPAGRFSDAVANLGTIGEVEQVTVDAQDVGEEFVDVTARLDNARRLEERLIELLAQRTGELGDVLMVERELARVREQIERFQGRVRYLQSRVAVSTLTVNVHEPAPLIGARPGTNIIADAFRQAWRNFVGVVAGFIAALGVIVPAAIALAAIWLLAWRPYRRRRQRAAHDDFPSPPR